MTENADQDRERIATFYDEFNQRLTGDFVKGNPRIEAAIRRVRGHLLDGPTRVLDIGCGSGYSSMRYAEANPQASVTAVDISPRNIDVAKSLFGDSGVRFAVSNLKDGVIEGEFDLIAMLDVHEHIPREDWPALHELLASRLSKSGTLVMTIPSPEHQRYLKTEKPEGLQVVDEIIEIEDVVTMSERLGARVSCFEYVDIWRRSEYIHVVFQRALHYGERFASPPPSLFQRIRDRIGQRSRQRFLNERLRGLDRE